MRYIRIETRIPLNVVQGLQHDIYSPSLLQNTSLYRVGVYTSLYRVGEGGEKVMNSYEAHLYEATSELLQ